MATVEQGSGAKRIKKLLNFEENDPAQGLILPEVSNESKNFIKTTKTERPSITRKQENTTD